MSLLLTSAFVAGGVLLGRWLSRRMRGPESAEPPKEGVAVEPVRRDPAPAPIPAKKSSVDPLAEFPCHLGDVVMTRTDDEAWLAGALVFFESSPAAALFVAPEAGGDRALYVRPRPSSSILWLSPVPASELKVGAEPPSSLEHDGTRFDRARRVPFRVERVGTGAPDVGEHVIVGEYASGLDRLVVVTNAGASRAWRGRELEEGMYDVLPSGKATLE